MVSICDYIAELITKRVVIVEKACVDSFRAIGMNYFGQNHMQDKSLILREPILNLKQQIIGYELSWLHKSLKSDEVKECNSLLEFVSNQFVDPEYGWLLPNHLIFLDIVPELLPTLALKLLPPKNIVLTINRLHLNEQLLTAQFNFAALSKIRAQGYSVCLRGADCRQLDDSILQLISHMEVCLHSTDVISKVAQTTQADTVAIPKQLPICILARQLRTWQDVDAYGALGIDAFAGEYYLTQYPKSVKQGGMNALQNRIVQLMSLTKSNAEFASLEAILQQTPELLGQLLDYIKAARFGLRPSIFALAHAVQLHGYSALYRWLTVLFLVNSDSYSAALMETALVRGRFAELLGIDNLSAADAENLFVVGMFSLADRMLSMPMKQLVIAANLPESVKQALLHREGTYGFYLSLIEACELPAVAATSAVDVMHVPIADVNQIHVSALIWAKSAMGAIGHPLALPDEKAGPGVI